MGPDGWREEVAIQVKEEKIMGITTLSRWDPFRDVASFQDQMSRLCGDLPLRFLGGDGVGGWYPPVDISEEEDRIVLRAELPGVGKDDIDINVENGTISLRGEKKQEKQVDSENAYRMERFYGSFSRSFVLPTTIDPENIKASFSDGVLEIVLPKADDAKPRKIQVG
jgi:HSP20 family protein